MIPCEVIISEQFLMLCGHWISLDTSGKVYYLKELVLVNCAAISAEKEKQADISVPPIPKSIHDISNGDHILGFGADLSEDHPVSRTFPCFSDASFRSLLEQ